MHRTTFSLIAFALLSLPSLASGLCSAEYDPVYCTLQGIEYPSRCTAVEAGYDPADCTIPHNFGVFCPTTVSSQIVCAGTLFDNICLASQAGFVPSAECGLPTNPPTQAPTRLPTSAPTNAPTRAPTPPPVCVKAAAACSIAAGSKPCCARLVCRLTSASGTSRTCRTCLANSSLCLENRDCCSKRCVRVSGRLRCKA